MDATHTSSSANNANGSPPQQQRGGRGGGGRGGRGRGGGGDDGAPSYSHHSSNNDGGYRGRGGGGGGYRGGRGGQSPFPNNGNGGSYATNNGYHNSANNYTGNNATNDSAGPHTEARGGYRGGGGRGFSRGGYNNNNSANNGDGPAGWRGGRGGRGGGYHNNNGDGQFTTHAITVVLPNDRTVSFAALDNLRKNFGLIAFKGFDAHSFDETMTITLTGKDEAVLKDARAALENYYEVMQSWFDLEAMETERRVEVPRLENAAINTTDGTHVGSATLKMTRLRYSAFKNNAGYGPIEGLETDLRQRLRTSVNRAYFPPELGNVKALPLAPAEAAPTGEIIVTKDPLLDGRDVVLCADSQNTYRRDDCFQAYWEKVAEEKGKDAAENAPIKKGTLLVRVHIVNAAPTFPIGSPQDRAFSATSSPFYFNTPTLAKMATPCGPYRDAQGRDVGIPSDAQLTNEDSEAITKACNVLREKMYFTPDAHRSAITANLYFDVVAITDGTTDANKQKKYVLQRNNERSFCSHSSVRLEQCFSFGEAAFEKGAAILKAYTKDHKDGLWGTTDTEAMHEALLAAADEGADKVEGADVSKTFGNKQWRDAVIAHHLSSLVAEAMSPEEVAAAAAAVDNASSGTATACATAPTTVDTPFPLYGLTRNLFPPRYECDKMLSKQEFKQKYKYTPCELVYSSSVTGHTQSAGILEEYRKLAARVLLASDIARPYIVAEKWKSRRFFFASEVHSFEEAKKAAAIAGEDYLEAIQQNLRKLGASIPSITHPGRDYCSLYTQRLLSLAIKGSTATGGASGAADTNATTDPHYAALSQVFDLENPEDLPAAKAFAAAYATTVAGKDPIARAKALLDGAPHEDDDVADEEEEMGASSPPMAEIVAAAPASAAATATAATAPLTPAAIRKAAYNALLSGTPLPNAPSINAVRAMLERQSGLALMQQEIKQIGRRIDLHALTCFGKGLEVPIRAKVICADHNSDDGTNADTICECMQSSADKMASKEQREGAKMAETAETIAAHDEDDAVPPPRFLPIPTHVRADVRVYHTITTILPESSGTEVKYENGITVGGGNIQVAIPWPRVTPCADCEALVKREKAPTIAGTKQFVSSACPECAPKVPALRSRICVLLSYLQAASSSLPEIGGTFAARLFYPETGLSKDHINSRREGMIAAAGAAGGGL